MKLDLNVSPANSEIYKSATVPSQTIQDPDQVSASVATAASSSTTDRTTFQSGPTSVKALVTTALATPEVRQNKIDTIRQSMSNGTYKFDAGKVADAIIAGSKQS